MTALDWFVTRLYVEVCRELDEAAAEDAYYAARPGLREAERRQLQLDERALEAASYAGAIRCEDYE